MFTPPPSPLPGAHFQPLDEQKASTSSSGLLAPPTPPTTPPEKPSFTLPVPPAPSTKQKKRKRYLPVLLAAIVLAVIAISARKSTLQALSTHWAPCGSPEPPVPTIDASSGEGGSESGSHVQGRRLGRRYHEEVVQRQATSTTPSGTSTAGASTTSDILGSGSASLPKYTAPPPVPSPALPVPTPFPAPFDISISLNVTTPNCVNFFNTFIQNVTFRACRPFGMLMSSSQQFQAAQDNLTTLTAIVGGTCVTDMSADQCGEVMDWHAEQIALDGNCGLDIDAQEALAVTALEGFRSYRMMRTAGCLLNPVSSAYCYVEAVASLLPNDLYYWVTALGIPLPNATAPTCSMCTQSLLGTYGLYANDSSLLISQTYPFAVDKAQEACGEGYASTVALANAAGQKYALLSGGLAGGLALLALLLQFL
ncbi:hypothetical protein CALVIDRAFT_539268 [Calocera viscosa TUFC12733]|uniref:DUF7729 domain-containing protein n=1 Tax=Calocera viscosa (strain TUFC12733) TaxID=1330018 RepID=A0A167K3P2_CALVF|nr:hypothetical protein CALVIDRAFT_539268 [Calocera viscosa TUFC12733]